MTSGTSKLAMDLDLVESINVDSGLTEWEVEFVDSVLRQVRSERKQLSDKQRQIAQRIQRKLDGNLIDRSDELRSFEGPGS